MAHVVVVSRNAALPFALSTAGHDVVVVNEDDDVRWGTYLSDAEVVLLELSGAEAVPHLIDDLAEAASGNIRVLLVTGHEGGGRAAPREGLVEVPLPLTMPQLTAALESALSGPPLIARPVSAVPEPVQPPVASPSPAHDLLTAELAERPALSTAAAEHTQEHPSPEPIVNPVPAPPSEATVLPPYLPMPAALIPPSLDYVTVSPEQHGRTEQEPAPEQDPVPPVVPDMATTTPMVAPYADPTEHTVQAAEPSPEPAPEPALEAEPETAAPAAASEGRVPAEIAPPPPRALSLVRALTAAAQELTGVTEAAEVVLGEALRQIPSGGGAVLIRDGNAWRVAAGEGLRPLEERLRLTPDHWLVQQVADSHNGVLLSGGHGQWSELYGAPLSVRAHLLCAPLPPLGAILLLARDDEEYVEHDLQRLMPLCEEAGHLLADAVDVRRLARLLAQYADVPD